MFTQSKSVILVLKHEKDYAIREAISYDELRRKTLNPFRRIAYLNASRIWWERALGIEYTIRLLKEKHGL